MILPGNGKPNEKRCVKKAVYTKFDAEILKVIRLRGVTLDTWNRSRYWLIGDWWAYGLMDKIFRGGQKASPVPHLP